MTTAPSPHEGPPKPEQGSLLEFFTFLLRHRRKITLSAGVVFVVVFLVLSLGVKQYTSSPRHSCREASSQSSALAAVAAQLFGASGIGVEPLLPVAGVLH